MSKFKSMNGKAVFTVPNHNDQKWLDKGYKKVAGKKPKSDNKDTAKTKALSEVESGETRTR